MIIGLFNKKEYQHVLKEQVHWLYLEFPHHFSHENVGHKLQNLGEYFLTSVLIFMCASSSECVPLYGQLSMISGVLVKAFSKDSI